MVRTLPEILADSAARFADRIAVAMDEETITYRELDAFSNRIANTLRENGVARGDRVTLLLDKSIAAVTTLFGVLKAGAICVPLDPNGPVERLVSIIEDCAPRALASSAGKKRRLDEILPAAKAISFLLLLDEAEIALPHRQLRLLTAADLDRASAAAPPHLAIDVDLAYILYTSGSTGRPKGVMISHRNVLAFIDWARDHFALTADDRVSSHAPLHFDLSLFDLYATLSCGGRVCLVPQGIAFMPVDLAEFIARQRITVWQSVPSVLVLLARQLTAPRDDFSALRVIFFAGEIFPPASLRELMARIPQARYYNVYGSTEINDVTCHRVETPPGDEPVPIGAACANADVFLLDEEGRLVTEPGIVGELHARGSTVSLGYWGDPEMTAARFVQNPLHDRFPDPVYRTGDLVELGADGQYRYVGRRDAQVKIRGYRVNLGEVEVAVRSHAGVDDVAVVDLPAPDGGRFLKAFVIAAAEADGFDPRALKRHCLARLPGYMLPEEFEICATLPRTSTGKIDRQRLRRLEGPAGR